MPKLCPKVSKIILGESENGRVWVDGKLRSTHMQVVGPTGCGKSKFLEQMIREDIIEDHGLCLLDPHGDLYEDIVKWCTEREFLDRGVHSKKILLFDITDIDWAFSYNPLKLSGADDKYGDEIKAVKNRVTSAIAQVWSGEDQDTMPRLSRIMGLVLEALVENKLSLVESELILKYMKEGNDLQKYLSQTSFDRSSRIEWESLLEFTKNTDYQNQVESTQNRFSKIIGTPKLKHTLGNTEQSLDFRKLMDEGWILLINLGSKEHLDPKQAETIGSLMINDMVHTALTRTAGSRPFYLYFDECHRFINTDVVTALDECRKKGLHLIMAHQRLNQLKRVDEKGEIFDAVMTNTKTKVVFGGGVLGDAVELGKSIFLDRYEPGKWDETSFRPASVGQHREIFQTISSSLGKSHSTTLGFSESENSSYGKSITNALSASQSEMVGSMASNVQGESQMVDNSQFLPVETGVGTVMMSQVDGDTRATVNSLAKIYSETESANVGKSSGVSNSATDGTNESYGVNFSEGLVTDYEIFSTRVISVEEQEFILAREVIQQPVASCLVKFPRIENENYNEGLCVMRVPFIKEAWASKKKIKEFKEKCYNSSDFTFKRDDVIEAIKKREEAFLEKVSLYFQDVQQKPDIKPEEFKVDEPEKEKKKVKKKRSNVEWPDDLKDL